MRKSCPPVRPIFSEWEQHSARHGMAARGIKRICLSKATVTALTTDASSLEERARVSGWKRFRLVRNAVTEGLAFDGNQRNFGSTGYLDTKQAGIGNSSLAVLMHSASSQASNQNRWTQYFPSVRLEPFNRQSSATAGDRIDLACKQRPANNIQQMTMVIDQMLIETAVNKSVAIADQARVTPDVQSDGRSLQQIWNKSRHSQDVVKNRVPKNSLESSDTVSVLPGEMPCAVVDQSERQDLPRIVHHNSEGNWIRNDISSEQQLPSKSLEKSIVEPVNEIIPPIQSEKPRRLIPQPLHASMHQGNAYLDQDSPKPQSPCRRSQHRCLEMKQGFEYLIVELNSIDQLASLRTLIAPARLKQWRGELSFLVGIYRQSALGSHCLMARRALLDAHGYQTITICRLSDS